MKPVIISLRKNPEYKDAAINFFQQSWPDVFPKVYEDCITHSLDTNSLLPQWYLAELNNQLIGGAGLITNDFISRMDLYPWLCALYIKKEYRGNSYGNLLIQQAKNDCKDLGFKNLYLATDHIGLYEKYGFKYIGQGYHPWEEESKIYENTI